MATMTENTLALWLWPLHAAKLGADMTETMLGAQRVISARMPTIASAIQDPFSADHRELGLMVSEKVGAFTTSARSVDAAKAVVQRAATANARTWGKLAGGRLPSPNEWMRLAEANLAATAAMAALPSAALVPLQAGVRANDRRLRKSGPR